MDAKVTWRIEVLSRLNKKSADVIGQITKVTWRIENFSAIRGETLYSEIFNVEGFKCRILFLAQGYNTDMDHLYIDLEVVDSEILLFGSSKYAQVGFAVIDQFDHKTSLAEVFEGKIGAMNPASASFCSLTQFQNPERGFLVNDACLLEAYVSFNWTKGLISNKLMLKTDRDEHKTKEADCVQAIDPEVPTEEDMKTFFTSLESELSSSIIVYPQEEAKKALVKLDEALNMTPVNFNDSEKFSPLNQAFKILASLDCASTTVTIEEKNELLAMEERLKELADRATKALEDKHHLTKKESMKSTITCNLGRNLIKYKEVESRLKEVEQKFASMLAERKAIFNSSKEMRMELEASQKECLKYEAKAKIAEEEAKIVDAEWGKIKDFISSIKGKI